LIENSFMEKSDPEPQAGTGYNTSVDGETMSQA